MSHFLKILGSGAARLAHDRHHTAQLLTIEGQHFLIDCGDTTPLQLRKYHIAPEKIGHIFISHLHEDHYLGLISLIFFMDLQGRTHDLHLYAFSGLAEIITLHLKHSHTVLRYPLHFHALTPGKYEKIFDSETVTVHTIPLVHTIDCLGFLFQKKDP